MELIKKEIRKGAKAIAKLLVEKIYENRLDFNYIGKCQDFYKTKNGMYISCYLTDLGYDELFNKVYEYATEKDMYVSKYLDYLNDTLYKEFKKLYENS